MADRDPRIIGARIAKRRHQLDMTQDQLAAALGVSKSTVANWERGVAYPKRKLGKVEELLGPLSDDSPELREQRSSRSTEQVADSIQADLDELRRRLREQDRRWNPPLRDAEQEEDDDDETNGKRRTG